MKNIKAFTLVELIVVVTILAILSTIGFVSYSGYLAGVRDTNRIAQLKAIGDALHLYSTNKSLPTPDNKIDIKTSTKIISYQGYVGKDVINTVGYTSEGLDPKDKTYFSYYLTKDKKYFQLMAFLEEEQGLASEIKLNNQIQAEIDYETRYPRVEGSKLGILTGTGVDLNKPVQELGITELDIQNTTITYNSYIDNEVILSGTGNQLKSLELKSDTGGKMKINKDGYIEFKVYGEWDYENNSSECVNIELFNEKKIKELEELFNKGYTDIKIDSDLEFNYQGDDSTPQHYLYGKKISDFSDYNLHLVVSGRNHTDLGFLGNNFDKIRCVGSTTSYACGTNGLPGLDLDSEPLIIYKLKMQPNCDGAITRYYNGVYEWYRNKFTFKGTYYKVLMK